MRMYGKIFILMLVAMFMMATASQATPQVVNEDLNVAPGGKGDVLIFPFYGALSPFETKLTVVNTDDSKSTVAKVVVRSPKYSGEVVDFLIYLSPADVWTGYLRYDADEGGPVIYSESGSIISDYDFEEEKATFGDEVPAKRALYTPNSMQNLKGTDYFEFGYVYVINVASNAELGARPVDKADIVDSYKPFSENSLGEDWKFNDEEDVDNNILSGWMDFIDSGYGVASLNAVTLENYNNETKVLPQKETKLAPENTDESGSSTQTTLWDIERALAKNDIAMPYLAQNALSLHLFTFPTKYTDLSVVESNDNHKDKKLRSPFAGFDLINITDDIDAIGVKYSAFVYDLEENTIAEETPIWSPAPPAGEEDHLIHQLNFRWSSDISADFEEGWINYKLDDAGGTKADGQDGQKKYYGAPVIPVSLDLTAAGMSFKYGSWTQGTVEDMND